MRNLEEKMYRAKAARYVPRGLFEFEPSEPAIGEAYTFYREINSKMLSILLALQDVPAGVDPLDFCVAADMLVFAKVLSEKQTHEKLKEILAHLKRSSVWRQLSTIAGL